MKKLCFVFISAVLLYGCLPGKKSMQSNNDKINFFFTYVMKINGVVARDTFNMYITQVDKYITYEIPYHLTSEIDNILIYDSLKYEFFIYDSTKNYGYLFRNLTDTLAKQIIKDSLLKSRAMMDIEMSSVEKIFKITSNSETINGNEIIHKYYILDTLTDSSYYYYKPHINNNRFSLSRILDSRYNSQLYKIILFYKKGIFSDKDSGIFDGLKMEIKKVPLTNLAQMKILIAKIEQGQKVIPKDNSQ